MKILLPPLGTKIEPAGGIFLKSTKYSLELPREHPRGVGRDWFSYFHNYPGLLGEEVFQCCCVFLCKKCIVKIKIAQGSPVLSLVSAFVSENIHPAPQQWPLGHSQSFLQGMNPEPWLWFNNRVIVHSAVDFALFISAFLSFLEPWVQSQTHHSFTNQLKTNISLAKQKKPCRAPRWKCLSQQCQEVPDNIPGQYCLRTGIWDPANPPWATWQL